MARTPKLRINFDSDIQYLLRLKYAVEEDEKWPKPWRDKIATLLHSLAMDLMHAPDPDPGVAPDGQQT